MAKKDNSKERTQRYRERQLEKEQNAAEAAAETKECATLDLRFFGESAFETDASWCKDEIEIHRCFLRALGARDVKPGETLRALAKRTWTELLRADGIGISKQSTYVWIPMFNPRTQDFDGGPNCQGYRIRGAEKDDFFDSHWTAPKDCTGDEVIDRNALPTLPPVIRPKTAPKPLQKIEPKLVDPIPPTAQILFDGRVKLLEQLAQDGSLDPAARRYLEGL